MKKSVLYFTLALSLCLTVAHAQDETYDPRGIAMGGVGVATANTQNAVFMNPSMLATKADDKFAFEFPIISVRIVAANNLVTNAKDLSTSANNMNTALTNFQAAQTPTSATAAANATTNFNSALGTVSGRALTGGGFVGTMLAIPSKSYSLALMLDVRAEVGAQFNYGDQATVSTLINNLTTCAAGTSLSPAACSAASGSMDTNGQINGLNSSQMLLRGIVAKDVGVTVAHHFESWNSLDVGITPKFTQMKTFDLPPTTTVQSGNNITLNNGASNENSQSVFNFDLGLSKTFSKTENSEVKGGLVVKDAISHTVQTVWGNNVNIRPRATVGIGYLTKLTTTGIDADVLSNKPLLEGIGQDSQFMRLGAEFDAWKWAQIRVGYRYDLKHNYAGLPSIGLGLFGLNISAAKANNNEVAVALQTGFHF